VLILSGRRDGVPVIFLETHGGGEGGSRARRGEHGIRVHLANTMNTPVEAIEAEFPIRVEAYELRDGSGGQGANAGGDGLRRVYRILSPGVELSTMFERCTIAPWGVFGGTAGEPTRIVVNPDHASPRLIGGKDHIELNTDDVVLVETAGGGGYGRRP
jgi:N-methylhydantoinase B